MLPVGVSDFKKLISHKDPSGNGYLFVDKSEFIKEFAYDGCEITVITRPRRFGKTINLSMLYYFYDIRYAEENKKLFVNLKIFSDKNVMATQGKHPVIYISFKDIKSNNYNDAKLEFDMLIRALFIQYDFLLSSNKIKAEQKKDFVDIMQGSANDALLTSAINLLSSMLFAYYNAKTIILIDEYDTPIQSAYLHGYYKELIAFVRSFLGKSLKDNIYLHRGCLTGILRVSKESIFSGINNLTIFSILSKKYCLRFGFTEQEISKLLGASKISYDLYQVRAWYNGYNFREQIIYNPWSIINFAASEGEYKNYWINSSGNNLIRKILIDANSSTKILIAELINGKIIKEAIDEHLVFTDINKNRSAIWSLLLMSGYLKLISKSYDQVYGLVCSMQIPNKEVEHLYISTFKGLIAGDRGSAWYHELLKNLTTGDIDAFGQQLQDILEQMASIYDVTKVRQEAFYHGLVLGLVSGLKGKYEVRSNRESGKGFYDLAIFPKDKQSLAVIMEFKAVTSGTDESKLQIIAEQALLQIKAKDYVNAIKHQTSGKIVQVGFAFSGKSIVWSFNQFNRLISLDEFKQDLIDTV